MDLALAGMPDEHRFALGSGKCAIEVIELQRLDRCLASQECMLQFAPQIGGEQARAFYRPAGRCAQRAWHNPIAIRPTPIEEIVLIPVIAGKQFVASLARQHNLHMLGRQAGDKVQRNARRPCDRLVFVPYRGAAAR